MIIDANIGSIMNKKSYQIIILFCNSYFKKNLINQSQTLMFLNLLQTFVNKIKKSFLFMMILLNILNLLLKMQLFQKIGL